MSATQPSSPESQCASITCDVCGQESELDGIDALRVAAFIVAMIDPHQNLFPTILSRTLEQRKA